MAHFCMFAGSEIELDPRGATCITIFGGTEASRRPIATELIEARRDGGGPPREHWLFTLFGGTEIRWPTLAEEFAAMRDAVRAGQLTLDDFDRLLSRPNEGLTARLRSFTVFGSLEAASVPSEDKELEAIALQRHIGQLPQRAADVLLLGVGQRAGQRLAAVRRAVAIALGAE